MSDMDSRPSTPDSEASLRDATATIDDLTRALANFSQMRSPEPLEVLKCCCGREDCEAGKTWATFKAKLESRLMLSAEVGQALLERHEAYVRRHEWLRQSLESAGRDGEQLDEKFTEVVRENATLEKRLSQALVQSELAETAHQSALLELRDVKDKLNRLNNQQARYVGLEQRLATVLQEKDDLQQERDSATQRARMAEARISSLKEKASKLKAQVNRLREDLEMQRSHRQELSEEVLTDARQRLRQLQQLQLGHGAHIDDTEVMKVLESLVADNEALKRDIAELQNILTETREDLRVLQEEVDERRANDTASPNHHHRTSSVGSTTYLDLTSPLSPTFKYGNAFGTPLRSLSRARPLERRSSSGERPRRVFEPLTPETDRHLSTKRTLTIPAVRRPDDEGEDVTSPQSIKPFLLMKRNRSIQTDDVNTRPPSAGTSLLAPSPIPRIFGESPSPSHEAQSEASSVADGQASVLGILLERVSVLTTRLIQADALTLTNRLKRQHLHAADIGHISRTTVNSVLSELSTLRTLFRGFLEDEKVTTTCTRKDLRGLFKLFKDLLSEMGQLRVILNDVILDPTIAGRVSDLAMHPTKGAAPSPTTGEAPSYSSSTPAWIAPLSKLLGLPGTGTSPENDAPARGHAPPISRTNSRGRSRPPPKVVPKREPALAATSTTVNVEFTGTGAGRAATTTATVAELAPPAPASITPSSSSSGQAQNTPPSVAGSSKGVMDIFVGAPRPVDNEDPWIVIPRPQQPPPRPPVIESNSANATVGKSKLKHFASTAQLGGASPGASKTIGKAKGTASHKTLSRIVDAVIDKDVPASPSRTSGDQRRDEEAEEARDVVSETLLERTLRPRGLSDSSIHATFLSQGGEPPAAGPPQEHGGGRSTSGSSTSTSSSSGDGGRKSVLQALSRKVQIFRFGTAAFASSSPAVVPVSVPAPSPPTVPSRPHTPANALTTSTTTIALTTASPDLPVASLPEEIMRRGASPGRTVASIFPTFSSWAAAAAETLEESTNNIPSKGPGPYSFVASPKDGDLLARGWVREI